MYNAQQLSTGFPTIGPAQSARSRLLTDPAMRRNRPVRATRPTASAPDPITYAPLSAELIRAAAGQGSLSREDQERRAYQVASSFRQHVLVDLTYHAEQQVTVATLRPKNPTAQPYDTAHKICVEANGNVSVLHHGDTALSEEHLIVHRLLLLVAGVTATVGALCTLILQ